MKQIIFIKPNLDKEVFAQYISSASMKVFSNNIKKYYNTDCCGWNLDINITDEMKEWLNNGMVREIVEFNLSPSFIEELKRSNTPIANVEDVCVAIGPLEESKIKEIYENYSSYSS